MMGNAVINKYDYFMVMLDLKVFYSSVMKYFDYW